MTDDHSYSRLIELLTEAIGKASTEGVPRDEVLPAAIDWLAMLCLTMGGEEVARLAMKRIEQRIDDWRNGTFPKLVAANDEPS